MLVKLFLICLVELRVDFLELESSMNIGLILNNEAHLYFKLVGRVVNTVFGVFFHSLFLSQANKT